MKYIITIERTIREFWRYHIEADSEKQANRKALREAKKENDEGFDTFGDGDEPRYRIYRVEKE